MEARNCKVSDIDIPDVMKVDVKFKVMLKVSGKLPSKRWVDLWNTDIFGIYKGTL